MVALSEPPVGVSELIPEIGRVFLLDFLACQARLDALQAPVGDAGSLAPSGVGVSDPMASAISGWTALVRAM